MPKSNSIYLQQGLGLSLIMLCVVYIHSLYFMKINSRNFFLLSIDFILLCNNFVQEGSKQM